MPYDANGLLISKKILRFIPYNDLIKQKEGIPMANMNKKWVALCTAALGAVYATGYITTEAQGSQTALSGTQNPAQISIQTGNTQNNNAQNFTYSTGSKSQSSDSTAPNKAQSKYKNGTFTGLGMNRRGSIQVKVTIHNDKITNVKINNFAMHYSESDVVGLPNEVLKYQSAQVDNVSGATYSTLAFENAVQDALAQAQNA